MHTPMRTLRTTAVAALALLALPALAKPWNGIDPGVSKRAEVLEKFGTPSRTVTQDGKEIIAYFQSEAIKGTTQAQFRVDPKSGVVERIDVFPGPVVDKDTIEASYGPMCPSGKQPATPCYQKKITDDFRTYFLYPKLGVAIFFNEDGKTVQSFIFTTLKAAQ